MLCSRLEAGERELFVFGVEAERELTTLANVAFDILELIVVKHEGQLIEGFQIEEVTEVEGVGTGTILFLSGLVGGGQNLHICFHLTISFVGCNVRGAWRCR